jgi:hypothetical protein
MSLKTKLKPIDSDIEVLLAETLSPEARSKALAAFARKELKAAQEFNAAALGYTPTHTTAVDGRMGASEDSVKPDGRILYEFDLLNGVFAWIGEQLVKHAPFKSGRFMRSFLFFADDQVVAPGAALPEAHEYVFISTVPYARKLERGYSDQAPDGVFEVVAKLAKNRYKGEATIRFSYRRVAENASGLIPYRRRATWKAKAIAKGAGDKRSSRIAHVAMKNQRDLRSPAIVIQL